MTFLYKSSAVNEAVVSIPELRAQLKSHIGPDLADAILSDAGVAFLANYLADATPESLKGIAQHPALKRLSAWFPNGEQAARTMDEYALQLLYFFSVHGTDTVAFESSEAVYLLEAFIGVAFNFDPAALRKSYQTAMTTQPPDYTKLTMNVSLEFSTRMDDLARRIAAMARMSEAQVLQEQINSVRQEYLDKFKGDDALAQAISRVEARVAPYVSYGFKIEIADMVEDLGGNDFKLHIFLQPKLLFA